MSWDKAIATKEEGEVGRVYFLNFQLDRSESESWTKGFPFTLNPEHGKTIEYMISGTKEVPADIKAKLIAKRDAVMNLESGHRFRVWISTEIAPDKWGFEAFQNTGRLIL